MDDRRLDPARLVLGTAQLGLPYGIANRRGKPDDAAAVAIVRAAWEGGITRFDTAQAYGDSEAVLGRAFATLGIAAEVRVLTKLDPRIPGEDKRALRRSVQGSLERLGVPALYSLLLHREEALDMLDGGFREMLAELRHSGLVQRLGVSVYKPARAHQAMETDLLKVIQIPASILDRRFQEAGVFAAAMEAGVEVNIRSAFLQGLILMNADHVPAGMGELKPVLNHLEAMSRKYQLSRQAMAMIYLRDRYPEAMVVFGAEEPVQVQQNMRCWQEETPAGFLEEMDKAFPGLDETILNPSKWGK